MKTIRTFFLLPALLLSLLLIQGCLKTQVQFMDEPGTLTYTQRQSFFVDGLFPQERTFTESQICPNGRLSQMETRTTGMDGFLGIITLGIYYPKTLMGWCVEKTKS